MQLLVVLLIKFYGGEDMRRKVNQEIRKLIMLSGYAQWEVAGLLNMGESTFSRLLRKELTAEQQKELIEKIQKSIKAGETNEI